MTTATKNHQSSIGQNPKSSSDFSLDRRSILRTSVALGAGGLALLSGSSSVRASSTSGPLALFNPLDYGAVGDASNDDTSALQDTIDAALALAADTTPSYEYVEPTIDLQGLTYRFVQTLTLYAPTDLLTPKMRFRVINGTLLYDRDSKYGQAEAVHIKRTRNITGMSGAYPEITFENVRIQKLQFQGVTGLWVEGGLRCSFINCAVEPRNIWDTKFVSPKSGGFTTGVLLQGAQICNFIDCHFSGNDNHIVFERFGSGDMDTGPSTDCRFYGCSFSESKNSAIVATAASSDEYSAAQCLFHGCTIETAKNASLVDLEFVRNAKFHSCRFEGNSKAGAPLVTLSSCSNSRFFDCNFSGTSSGYPCLYVINGSTDTTLVGNVFPSSATPISSAVGGSSTAAVAYRSVANHNLTDY